MLKYAALALALSAAPAFAQTGATQSPPAPNASSFAPQPVDSVPAGGLTAGPAQSPQVGPVLGSGVPAPVVVVPVPGPAMSTAPAPVR